MNKRLLISAASAVCVSLLGAWALWPRAAQLPIATVERPQHVAAPPQGLERSPASSAAAESGLPSATPASAPIPPLISRIQLALAHRDGKQAKQLSGEIGGCAHVDQSESSYRTAMNENGAIVAAVAVQHYQAKRSQCQTVAGQEKALRVQLLQLAKEQQMPGAAAELWAMTRKRGEPVDALTQQQILRDALGGDDVSATLALMHDELRAPAEDQEVLRRAMQQAGLKVSEGTSLGIVAKLVASLPVPSRQAFTAAQLAAIDQRAAAVAAALLAAQ